MTFKDIFYSLLIPHICAGFYIQTPKQQPQSSRKKIINHIIYALVTLIIPKVISANIEWRYLLAIIIFHSLISVFISLAQNLTKITQKQVFITEHFLHMLTLVFISYRMIQSNKTYQYITLFIHAENITEIPTSTIISFITKLLLIHKPANLLIVNLMRDYKPAESIETESNVQSGRMIGTMERMIMLYFLSIDQYSSVGLVLTAKSIARYNKISESKEFAEYYLSGTLLSTICVLTVSLI